MNTQQGSSTGLNTVNYVIFLNISDSAVFACEELPGSQIQSDRSSPPTFTSKKWGESFKYRTEKSWSGGKGSHGLCCFSRVGAQALLGLKGARGQAGHVWVLGGSTAVCEPPPSSVTQIQISQFSSTGTRAEMLQKTEVSAACLTPLTLFCSVFSSPSHLSSCSKYFYERNVSVYCNNSVFCFPV